MDNISFTDFDNICRTCMLICDVKFTQDNVILNVFYKLTDIHFETCDELPQQICSKCFKKINEIHEFAFQCKQTHSSLLQCVYNLKNRKIKEEPEILEVISDPIKTENKILIDEHEINYVNVEVLNATSKFIDELSLKQEIVDDENNELEEVMIAETNFHENINCFVDVLQTNTIKIEGENEEASSGNGNNFNGDSSSSFGSSYSAENIAEISRACESHNKNLSCERPYKCKSSKPTSETSNVRSFSDERPYKCDECAKSYSKAFGLKVHMRTHSGERPFECNQCSKSFVQRISLIQHVRTHTGERPYKCEICSRMFSESSNLKKHMRTHSGERLYECNQCPKSFSMLAASIRHMRMHNGARPFKCEECSKAFSRSDTLKKHLFTHSGERPYKCEHCSKSFTQATNLTRHLRAHHDHCSATAISRI